ncbi:toxin-antitoxin system YwqK family antitoxin [Halosquirtibacter xylanolyticus]|uniref:toxin-antitoxin system YwqK family antitoxin n=1 Tax=Halosquirtibacter xylanolyticus TaxID=3374599 RepID=UPI00374A4A41|nr:toxin-antitoxin system YwqK family antitoxin [Prolixibacteraceae bacterium]
MGKTILRSWLISFFIGGMIFTSLAQHEDINQLDDNGKKNGVWVVKRKNGTLKYRGLFKNGHPSDKLYRYNEDGKLKCIMNYSLGGDTVDAIYYYPKGTKSATGRYINRKKTGAWKMFLKDGNVSSVLNFKRNQLHGISKTYYDNGNMKSLSKWQDGKLSGTKFEYYKEGALLSKSQYKDGIEFGIHRELYRDGKVRFEGSIENGMKQGAWRYYDVKGELGCELQYNDDKLLNPEELDKLSELVIPTKEDTKNKYTDPKDFIYNPMEYIHRVNKMQKSY